MSPLTGLLFDGMSWPSIPFSGNGGNQARHFAGSAPMTLRRHGPPQNGSALTHMSLRANGPARSAADDRLREAIQRLLWRSLDCFGASRLAMTTTLIPF
jgi:hypothetical protein